MIEGVALVAWPGLRARAFLQMSLAAGVGPDRLLLLGDAVDDQRRPGWNDGPDGAFRAGESLRETAARARLAVAHLPVLDLADPRTTAAVSALGVRWAVFSGGGRLGRALLDCGPRWIHVHPGRLPDYRGSTCHYYGLLAEGGTWATAFVMEAGLDTGAVLAETRFVPPPGLAPEDLDHAWDAWIRGRVLVSALRRLREGGDPPLRRQSAGAGRTYYVIHPVLKNLAVLAHRPRTETVEV